MIRCCSTGRDWIAVAICHCCQDDSSFHGSSVAEMTRSSTGVGMRSRARPRSEATLRATPKIQELAAPFDESKLDARRQMRSVTSCTSSSARV